MDGPGGLGELSANVSVSREVGGSKALSLSTGRTNSYSRGPFFNQKQPQQRRVKQVAYCLQRTQVDKGSNGYPGLWVCIFVFLPPFFP